MRLPPNLSCLLALAALLGATAAMPARAETVQTCAGFIDAVPTTISTQGNWCLREDLSTAIDSGAAITIATNNVTIDCNGFKVGGLAAGDGSMADGILAVNRLNITVRNCGVRGFRRGIALGGSGHLVADNRLDQNLYIGIGVFGDGHHVQRNRVFDTGSALAVSYGITGAGDMVDNTVDGVFATATDATVYGINSSGAGSEIARNRVRNLVPQGSGAAHGLLAGATGITLRDNSLALAAPTTGNGIHGIGPATSCTGNVAIGFSVPFSSCDEGFQNLGL